jgi:low temperature requirement protein LtrA
VVALSWVWLLTTLVNNILPANDIIRRGLMLVQMALIVVAVLTIDQSIDVAGATVMLAFGGALLVIPLLILADGWMHGVGREPDPRRGALLAALTVPPLLCGLGALLGAPALVWLLGLALVVSGLTVLWWQYGRWWNDDRLRLEHLRERLGLFVIIILGEGFAQLVAALHGLGTIPRSGTFALIFLVSFALWWIYFDGLTPSDDDLHTVRWRLSLLGHLTLVLGIAGTLDILVLVAAADEDVIGDHVPGYFAACVALVLVSFALLRFAMLGRLVWVGLLNAASAIVVLGISAIVDDTERGMDVTIVLSALVVIVNGVVTASTRQPGRTSLAARARAALRGSN